MTTMRAYPPIFQSSSQGLTDASYRAVTTLSFVAPESVIPEIVAQVGKDIDAQEVKALTDEEIAIWATPEGVVYVDGMRTRCHCWIAVLSAIPSSGQQET
jgi:hypothetical protein